MTCSFNKKRTIVAFLVLDNLTQHTQRNSRTAR
ncbi:MAG: hypothetical protein JWQ40_3308 [Segetibacter sp.]|nr:hypothetical protein [Segetibacter sp.]